jgi:hypothetical protein
VRAIAILSLVAALLLITVFVLIPRAETPFRETVTPSQAPPPCPIGCSPHSWGPTHFEEGGGHYSTIFGTWNASVEGGVVFGAGYLLVTIESNSSGTLYSSTGSSSSSGASNEPISGSFDVSGTGPFVFTLLAEKPGTISATVQGTILTW